MAAVYAVKERHVPAQPLALGRGRRLVKEGWAARLRALKFLSKKKTYSAD